MSSISGEFFEEPCKPHSLEMALEQLMTEAEQAEPTEGQISSDQLHGYQHDLRHCRLDIESKVSR